jgi:hypothetical protein
MTRDISKWDNYTPIFLHNSEIKGLDFEQQLPASVEIAHFLFLFLSDFSFIFLSKFAHYSNFSFSSSFTGLEEFFSYVLSIFSNLSHNFFNIFNFSNRFNKLNQTDCEKQEYSLKDVFNHYGLCLISVYGLNSNIRISNLQNVSKTNSLLYSMTMSSSKFIDMMQSIVISMLNFEKKESHVSEYIDIVNDIANLLLSCYYEKIEKLEDDALSSFTRMLFDIIDSTKFCPLLDKFIILSICDPVSY